MPPARNLAIAALLAGQVASCGNPEPLSAKSVGAKALQPGEWDSGTVVAVMVELENRGPEPVHLSYESAIAAAADGAKTSVRAFRKRHQEVSRSARSPQDLEQGLAALARIGIDKRVLDELQANQVEILPGRRVGKILPFLFAEAPTRMAIELRYHDDATDRIFRSTLDVRVR